MSMKNVMGIVADSLMRQRLAEAKQMGLPITPGIERRLPTDIEHAMAALSALTDAGYAIVPIEPPASLSAQRDLYQAFIAQAVPE